MHRHCSLRMLYEWVGRERGLTDCGDTTEPLKRRGAILAAVRRVCNGVAVYTAM